MKKKFIVDRYNFQYQFSRIKPTLLKQIQKLLISGNYILSDEVDIFEKKFSKYIGTKHSIGVNSGTDALILTYRALSIGPGDEIISVANTFHATILAILRVGATPKLVDCNLDNYQIDINQIEKAITSKTRAITVVHLFGKAVNMDPILRIAKKYNLYVIEDCAQSIGAKYKNKRVGSFGIAGCFSFHPSKNLAAAGDAGAITTNNSALNARLRRLRQFGQKDQNGHRELGYNSRLDGIQALILLKKLPFVNRWNKSRYKKAKQYIKLLSKYPLNFPQIGSKEDNVFHLFQVQSKERNQILRYLQKNKIDAVVRYPVPIHLQPAFSFLKYKKGDFPNSELLAKTTFCLPIRPDLTDKENNYVCKKINSFYSTRKLKSKSHK